MANRLYNASTGALLATVQTGSGLRGKSWLDELSQMQMEGANITIGAAGPVAGYGRLANYMTILNGEQLSSSPIGGSIVGGVVTPTFNPSPNYAGVTLYKCRRCSLPLGALGIATYGSWGPPLVYLPTQPARNHANYGGAGAGDNFVQTPIGSSASCRATSEAATYNLGSGTGAAGVWTFPAILNGVTYTITGHAANLDAVTALELLDGINNSIGGSGFAAILVGTGVRIMSDKTGRWNTIRITNSITWAVDTALSTVTTVLANTFFTTNVALAATTTGQGGPLNDPSRQTTGNKAQRRILPGSITVTSAVVAGAAIAIDTWSSGTVGTLAGTHNTVASWLTGTNTVNYLTGDFNCTFDAVTTVAPSAVFTCLIPVELTDMAREPAGTANDYAILLN
jgi:hypothetical protein